MFGRRKYNLALIISSQIFISLILLGLLAFLLAPTIKNYRQQRQVDQEIAELKQRIAEAEQQNNDFKKMLEYLESDSFIQEQARVNLGLKRPGEQVAVINTDIKTVTAVEQETDLEIAENHSLINSQFLLLMENSQKWLAYFFKQSQEWESNP